jgi:mRNA-decapping enzyme 1B
VSELRRNPVATEEEASSVQSEVRTEEMALNINSAGAEKARHDANLRLLQRKVDPAIAEILGNASHVVLYHFQQHSNSWEKSNVEGSMFLTVRPAGYLLVILNRNSPTNYPIVLTRDFQLQQNDPYLIFKNYEQDEAANAGNRAMVPTIRGIWFPNDNERSQMNDLLSHILQDLRDNKPLPLLLQQRSEVATMGGTGTGSGTIDPASATAALLASLNVSVSSSSAGQAAAAAAKAAAAAATSPTQWAAAAGVRQASPSSNSIGSGGGGGGGHQPTLDKKSLQLALLSLIQDERFLDLLHAKYLMVHHARSNRGGGGGNGNN